MLKSKVKPAMSDANVTMRALVAKTGLSMQTVNRARGPMIVRCTLETLATIAVALGVKIKDLFDED